jgi:hypothetical protein
VIKIVLVTLVAVIILGVFGWLKFRRDEKIVIEFLKNAGVEPGDDLTTTAAISSATRLSETRIRKVCSKSAMIKSHRKEKGCWIIESRKREVKSEK